MTKSCATCGSDISGRGRTAIRCLDCAKAIHKIQIDAANLKARQATAAKRAEEAKGQGVEYLNQSHSPDGQAYLIPMNNFGALRVAKRCQTCHKGNEQVKGKWAPIFTKRGVRGGEGVPVLLCLDCYAKECDKGLRRAG